MPVPVLRHRDGTPVGEFDIESLRYFLHGTILSPGEHAYEEACKNIPSDSLPGIFARCQDRFDVGWVVKFARAHDIPLAVMNCRDESIVASPYQDRLVVDLAMMDRVAVLPEVQIVYAEAGASLIDVENKARRRGLTLPGILMPTRLDIAVSSIDWPRNKDDLNNSFLLACEGVTARGDYFVASSDTVLETSDRNWFKVVTSFAFRARRR
ncbi:FAD-binding protein [Paraburkholderia humisilvae]|uniref:FAD linked oxidase N-terminal domain-containing protein n=1 Tax=Paraburkholderia humisilvae TaxID=627669 RepID=A0A6J5E025_9BURK|nr:FAD-binding protein [Paraburkholderia humisilvae]CAB3759653.1 hypothetical protein LMG29542_03638 [Paraburkholderia humisilvae]